ncbi:hypothetical protein GCM10027614_52450 [Micromonospora vulcania]
MGSIHPGDDGFHHHDWSHRWSGGPGDEAGQSAYQAALKAHMEDHCRGEDTKPRRTDMHPASPTGPDRQQRSGPGKL